MVINCEYCDEEMESERVFRGPNGTNDYVHECMNDKCPLYQSEAVRHMVYEDDIYRHEMNVDNEIDAYIDDQLEGI